MLLFRGGLLKIGNVALNRYSFGLIKFHLPDLGAKIKEGTIKQIYVKEGDTVEEFQKLADVASDKQFTQITASDSGTIKKIYYSEEEVCQVGDLFLEILSKDGEEAKVQPEKASSSNDKPVSKATEKHQGKTEGSIVQATPFVRGLIKSYGLDINKIEGSGKDGRVTEGDVQKAVNKSKGGEVKKQEPKNPTAKAPAEVGSVISNVTPVTMSAYEKGMQKSMTESNTIPHLYLHEEFDITQVQKMRKALKQSNKKVTVMGILIKTFSLALKLHPRMNSIYQPDIDPYSYSIHPNHNISIAIDSPSGLVVPHLKNVNQLSLIDIQGELQRLRGLASQARLSAKQLQGGTICLSNIGTIGGTHACPLILPPQVCIVAIGKLQSVPKYRGGELVERKVLNVSYGCDHRVLDGASVARFSNTWKQLIQNPYLSIAEMI